jgi:predicted alpha/beta superfamily hydrolase
MKRFTACFSCLLLVVCCSLVAVAEDSVKVKITVTVPKETDPKATLYLAGSNTEWKQDGSKLTRLDDGTYQVELALKKGETLEYKITGGTWETVEKDAKGEEIDNRKLVADSEKEEKIKVEKWASPPGEKKSDDKKEEKKSTLSGDVRVHEHFASRNLGNERTVLVWLPPGYEKEVDQRYPVLYMHDGQNCFDAATSFAGEWRADETAGELIKSGKIIPIIIVAVANSGAGRIDEYTPTADPDEHRGGGTAELYAKFLIEEVKPFIDSHYRTLTDRNHTAVAGSSLGGLVSLYLAAKHGDVFSMAGSLSASVWWDHQQIVKSIAADPQILKHEKIWLDNGTAEGKVEDRHFMVEALDSLIDSMKKVGMVEGKDFVCRQIEGGEHNEKAWAARFDQVLLFFFAK